MKPTAEMLKAFAEARDGHKHMPYVYEQNRLILTAVMPLIVEAVAEQIAQQIEAGYPPYGAGMSPDGQPDRVVEAYGEGMNTAVHIAREYAKEQNDD